MPAIPLPAVRKNIFKKLYYPSRSSGINRLYRYQCKNRYISIESELVPEPNGPAVIQND